MLPADQAPRGVLDRRAASRAPGRAWKTHNVTALVGLDVPAGHPVRATARTLFVFLAIADVIATVGVANARWLHRAAASRRAKASPTLPPVRVIAPAVPASVLQPQRPYLGVATPANQFASFAAATGSHPQIFSQYVQVGQPFTAPPLGTMPYISLETSTSPAAVIAGSDNTALGLRAAQSLPMASL